MRMLRLRDNTGLSLIELMVALAIGAFLVLGIVTVFLANRSSARLENSLATLQENGRFAIDLMREDIHRAQFLGCNTGDVFLYNMIDDPNDPNFANAFRGVRGYQRADNGDWVATPDPNDLSATIRAAETATPAGARNGSDLLSLRMTESLNPDDPNDFMLTALVLPTSTSVAVDDNPDCQVEQGSRVVLTGCNLTAHLFQVSNAQTCNASSPPNATTFAFGAPDNATTVINNTYNLDAQVLIYEEAVWFVADSGRNITRDGISYPVYALFREVNGVRQEMIAGVEYMQIMFGQRIASSDNLRFVAPDDATLNAGLNYEGLSSVRVAMLMQSFDSVRTDDDERSYSLLGVPYSLETGSTHAGGRFQREVFTATINLRNAPEF